MQGSKLIQCAHCGKQTVFYVRAEGTQDGAGPVDPNNQAYDGAIITTWRVLECAVCKKPTLTEETVDYTFDIDYGGRFSVVHSADSVVLYPEAKTAKTPLANLPATIETAYRAALKVQDIEPNACAVLVGRTLEAVCNHEKVKKGFLADRLKLLAASERFPKTLSEIADQLKDLRNLGAHANEDEITEEDIPIIIGFLEIILEYLYVAPAKIAAVQERLKKKA